MDDSPFFLHTLLDPRYFESVERYRPSDELLTVVQKRLEGRWRTKTGGFWTHCSPADRDDLRRHGWKIHLSAVEQTAVETLERVVPILSRHRVAFKFCSDLRMTRLAVNKNWPRTGAGKFVTIFPAGESRFVALIEELHQATRDLRGPYILSDRPYKDSKVVFYRYGEYWGETRLDPLGRQRRGFSAPDGTWFADDRQPFFHIPPGIRDPLSDTAVPQRPEGGVVLKDRYRAKRALRFSALGGIYEAVDPETGRTVVIREARPMLGGTAGGGTFRVLEKEARILQRLGSTGFAPRFVDLFREWEHLFLVQEHLDAQALWGYAIGFTYDSPDFTPADTFRRLRDTFRKIAVGLRTIHDHGVVLRDLTKTNVLVTPDHRIKFIDFEFAFELSGNEPPLMGWTAGYASPDQLRRRTPSPPDDHYALGALLLDMIAFTASGYDLHRPGILRAFRQQLSDLRLPHSLYDIVVGLTDPEVETRWDLERALEALEATPEPSSAEPLYPPMYEPPDRPLPGPDLRKEVESTLDGVIHFLYEVRDPSRQDRLWPSSPEVFLTNGAGYQYGAAGVAHFLWRATGKSSKDTLKWIAEHANPATCPPGLFTGLAGIALVLHDLGEPEIARNLVETEDRSELLWSWPGLYYGAAGWGLANLVLWVRTGDSSFRQRALEVGARLVETATPAPAGGVSWETDGENQLGLAYGPAGISLFLLYLYAASSEEPFLETGLQALEHDVRHQVEDGFLVFWRSSTTAGPESPLTPHMLWGTAGMGTVLVRYHAVTGDPRYRKLADRCAYTASRRHTNKLWQDYGLAGFGEFLLDMYRFLDEERYLANAFHLAETLLLHRIKTTNGYAFAGRELLRVSCDHGMGTAGIGAFLHRLLHPETQRSLFLDELLTGIEAPVTARAIASRTRPAARRRAGRPPVPRRAATGG